MLASYLTGLVAVVVVTLAWIGVQGAWRRAFPEASSDPDVLAGRMGCHGCRGGDCGSGHCLVEHGTVEPQIQIEHNGRLGAAEEEIP